MKASLLCIGTELTRGELADANGPWLARELTEGGVEVLEIAVVADEPAAIAAALRRLSAESELLLCTGGLGPTTDDVTTAVVADLLGVELVRDPESLERVRARLAIYGRPLTESNAKQADFPAGARVVPNDAGTAPGFRVRIGPAEAWFLPGPPAEMRAMFAAAIAPAVLAQPREPVAVVQLRTFGLGESAVNDQLAGLEAEHDVVIGYRATFPEVLVKAQARRATEPAARAAARQAAQAIVSRLGAAIAYGEGDAPLPALLGRELAARGLRLALAESCTGGLVGALLTSEPGASRFLLGGAIVYANAAKEALLGVPGGLLREHGAVSPQVAQAMAEGALRAAGADLALAITGIAGPDGGSPDKPVGWVELAVVGGGRLTTHRQRFPSTRERVRTLAAWTGMRLVREHAAAMAPAAPGPAGGSEAGRVP